MSIAMTEEMRRFIEGKVRSGEYASEADVLRAGIARLMWEDDFAPGEMERLIAKGEADMARGDVVEGEQVFAELREMRKDSRSNAG